MTRTLKICVALFLAWWAGVADAQAIRNTGGFNGTLKSGQCLRLSDANDYTTFCPNNGSTLVMGAIYADGGLQIEPLADPVFGAFAEVAGTLAAGTYCYRVGTVSGIGADIPIAEQCLAVTGANNGVTVNWSRVPGASDYDIYCRTTAAEQYCATVTGGDITTWTDDGTAVAAGAIPTVDMSGDVNFFGTLRSMVPSGGDAIRVTTDGARIDFGSGASDYASSDATTVTFAGPIAGASTIAATGAVSSNVATGNNAFGVLQNGGRVDFGAGASDYATSNGTTVTFAGALTSAGNIVGSSVLATGNYVYAQNMFIWGSVPALPTCEAGTVRQYYVQGGAGGARHRTCLCTYDGTSYLWANTSTNTYGTNAVCPASASVMGRAVLVAGAVTVSTTSVNATSVISLSRCVAGGTAGDLSVGTVTDATSFVINSANGADTSTICWLIMN